MNMTVDLTENELKVVMNEVWLRLYGTGVGRTTPKGSYKCWLEAAHAKLHAALPPIQEFAENH